MSATWVKADDRYSRSAQPRQLLGLMNNFQPLPAFILIFIANIIRFYDRIDFGQVDFDISYFKDMVQNFIGITLIIAQPNTEPTLLHEFHHFYGFIQKPYNNNNTEDPVIMTCHDAVSFMTF